MNNPYTLEFTQINTDEFPEEIFLVHRKFSKEILWNSFFFAILSIRIIDQIGFPIDTLDFRYIGRLQLQR